MPFGAPSTQTTAMPATAPRISPPVASNVLNFRLRTLERAGIPLMTGTQHATGLCLPWWAMADARPITPDAPAAARPGTASSHAEEDL